jgi:hypothetical protein
MIAVDAMGSGPPAERPIAADGALGGARRSVALARRHSCSAASSALETRPVFWRPVEATWGERRKLKNILELRAIFPLRARGQECHLAMEVRSTDDPAPRSASILLREFP